MSAINTNNTNRNSVSSNRNSINNNNTNRLAALPTNTTTFSDKVKLSAKSTAKLKGDEPTLFFELLKDGQEAGGTTLSQLEKMKAGSTPRLKAVATNLISMISAGESLSEAMRRHPNAFKGFACSLIEACERSGKWTKKIVKGEIEPGILDLLLSFLKRSNKARRALRNGMIYPGVIIAIMVIAVCIFAFSILPTLKDIFVALNVYKSLGFLSTSLFDFGEWIQNNYYYVPFLIIGLVSAIYGIWHMGAKQLWETYQLRIKFVKNAFIRASLAESMMLLGVLYSAGLSVTESLPIVGSATKNKEVGKSFEVAKDWICTGESLSVALEKAHFVFNEDLRFRISAAESNGKLDTTLINYATQQFEKLDEDIEALLKLIEPAFLVVIGGVIGLLLVSIYGAMGSAIANIR